jgi:hypothetical protein
MYLLKSKTLSVGVVLKLRAEANLHGLLFFD